MLENLLRSHWSCHGHLHGSSLLATSFIHESLVILGDTGSHGLMRAVNCCQVAVAAETSRSFPAATAGRFSILFGWTTSCLARLQGEA